MKNYRTLGLALVVLSLGSIVVFANSSLKTKDWHTGTSQLTISADGRSATITEPCGEITIASGWNEQGVAMHGVEKGGPVVLPSNPGTPETITAKLTVKGLVLQFKGDSSTETYAPGAAPRSPFICE